VELVVDGSVDALGSQAFDAVVNAARVWQTAAPDLPRLVVRRGHSARIGYRSDGANHNVVRFEGGGEPRANGALAITVLTYDSETGEILDADIVLNGIHPFSAEDGDARSFDLQNVLTHEIGHFLGLGEDTDDSGATMYAYSELGETDKRVLHEGDVARVAQLYGSAPGPNGGRGVSLAPPPHSAAWAGFGAAVAAIMVRLRRRIARDLASGAIAGALAAVATGDGSRPIRLNAEAVAAGQVDAISECALVGASNPSYFSLERGVQE
jgi:hypothetical protein